MVLTSDFFAPLSLFFLASPVFAAPWPFGSLHGVSKRGDEIWNNCTIFEVTSPDPNLACGYVEVPLDYHDANAGQARLAVARYAATAPKKAGTLFVNPGGPGESGVNFVLDMGLELSALFQGAFEIVSWDPRGVGLTFPGTVTCFDSDAEETAFFQNTIVSSINYTIAGGFDKQDQQELFSRTQADADLLTGFGKKCQQGPVGKYLQYIGTSSTVRDLVSLADCLVGQDKPIDFWGFSYGTIIGSNFLNLFPQRAGHVILDGVVDPNIWATNKLPNSTLTNSEKAFSVFSEGCAASGPAGCNLVGLIGKCATGPEITQLIQDSHDAAVNLLRAGCDTITTTPGELTGQLLQTLGTPALWSNYANEGGFNTIVQILQAAHAKGIPVGNNKTYQIPSGSSQLSVRGFQAGGSAQTGNSFDAIIGGDGPPIGESADSKRVVLTQADSIGVVLNQILKTTQTTTPTFGANWHTGYSFGWPVRSVEPLPPLDFSGLTSPVLLIANSADPMTSFDSAQSAAQQIGAQAILVQQLGVGHTSLAQSSACTQGIIANYLLNSKLPDTPSGGYTQCPVDSSDNFPPIISTTSIKRSLNTLMYRRL